MRKEVPRDPPANRSRDAAKPGSTGKGVKRVVPAPSVVKKKKLTKPSEETTCQNHPGDSKVKKKLLKPKVVLTKLSPGSVSQLAKAKAGKDLKKDGNPKPVKPKPKKVIVSKGTKKDIKLENESRGATSAKLVRAVKDVKKARSVVASKMAKNSPKRLSNSETVRKLSGGINVVKKRVNKMSGKKPCVVSVKISNAHSTVTLSVKQNKQVGKKDMTKCLKSIGGKNTDRSTISIVKKGIASRRKSTSKECTSQESSPSQSPTRDISPVRSKEGKSASKCKKIEGLKAQKKVIKQSSIDSKMSSDDKFKDKLGEPQNKDSGKGADSKTEVIITENLKIKTENVGEHQNMEIEFTNESSRDQTEKDTKASSDVMGSECNEFEERARAEYAIHDSKVKSPLNEYSNLKSIDSTASDEIPLQILKSKQRGTKQDRHMDSLDCLKIDSIKQEKDFNMDEDVPQGHLSNDKPESKSNSDCVKGKGDSEKQLKSAKRPRMSKTALQKFDEESVAKLKISATTKAKLKKLALKHKEAKLAKTSKLRSKKTSIPQENDDSDKSSDSDQARRRKLHKFWNGPKRHRVASLNAIAKVHCLYENETRSALNDVISSAAALQRAIQESKREAKEQEMKKKKPVVKKPATREKKCPEPLITRSLRTNPHIRSVGRNFDILNVISSTSLSSSSSSEESSDSGEDKKQLVLPLSVKQKQLQIKEESDRTSDDEIPKQKPMEADCNDGVKKVKKRRRKRNELTMDLKDMVVRKRMASLNASAIMTASYSTEKKSERRIKEEEIKKEKKERKKRKKQTLNQEAEYSSGDEDVIVRTTNNKQKVAVIVNQDTDVTITGVYVNSTTRSTHHEGYCSIAGMQYRISSTSHTQTEATAVATAVATETVLHSEHPPRLPDASGAQAVTSALAAPCKSYTPLSALSSMQPPGHHPCGQPPRGPPLSPLQRRHGCSSAFTAPPNYPQHPPQPPVHSDVHGNYRWEVDMPCCGIPTTSSRICYYQPAGPLITSHHLHHHTAGAGASGTAHTHHHKLAPPPSPTPPPSSAPHPPSESSDSEVVLTASPRYPPPPQQPYSYGYQYYPSPPASGHQYHPQDLCYPPGYPGYPKGHYPRRYPPQYPQYPQEYYPGPAPANSQQMMVSAPSGGTPDGAYPAPAPASGVDPYPLPPPPQTYYPGYGAGPPPHCYTTHSPSRGLYLDAAYQGCPCPMQSCPKNVHTGPLTGASKGSIKNHESTMPLVALSLPLEPAGVLGPPSPARGSAGMPPPPSPALATARNPPQSPPAKQTGLLTIGKMVTDAVMLTEQVETNIAELIPKTEPIKLEVEDIVKIEATEEVKCNRKRRKSLKAPVEMKRQAFESAETEIKVQGSILQDRLITPKEEPERIVTPELERPLEKQVPLSDNGATVPVVEGTLNGLVSKNQTNKRKSVSSDCEPAAKIMKCVKGSKVLKNKCVKRNKPAEENIAPDVEPVVVEASKVVCRRSSKPVERRKSSCSPHITPTPVSTEDENNLGEESDSGKKKKIGRTKKAQEKTKADHLLRSHGKVELTTPPLKERRLSKSGGCGGVVTEVDPSAESQVCLPGLRRSLLPKWSNGWSWEGSPYKAKVFLNNDDGALVRTCYPAMRHEQGDIISPRDCILLKSGPRKTDLPFVAKVSAMWENPDDGEMMVSLLWYYRPEHTEQGRRSEDIPDEIFASRHKDTNSVACIEDKCFVLTFNEYCRYRKTVRRVEEGLASGARVVPPTSDPRLPRQPPGRVAPDLVFFCRRVYDFRQKRILKNPC